MQRLLKATKEDLVQEVQAPLPGGAVIQGRYIVESLLGKGDFGTIYLVRDEHKKQKLFVLAEVFNPNEQESYHFTLEYVALTSLDHRVLPGVQYVFNDDKLGRAYVLMSYIEDPTLEILRLQQPEKRFPLQQVLAFMTTIFNALTYLHQRYPPVIHQHINPTSIAVSRTLEAPVLMMLNLVKILRGVSPERSEWAQDDNEGRVDSDGGVDSVARDVHLDSSILHYFAPGYGAPEQYGREVSIRTDIYALGATIYTLLTGIVPLDALSRKEQIASRGIDPLQPVNKVVASIPAHIADSIDCAMSLDSDDRFPTVEEFRQALEADPTRRPSPVLNLQPMEQELDQAAEHAIESPPQPGASLTEPCTESALAVQGSVEPVFEPASISQEGSTSVEQEAQEPGDVSLVHLQSPDEILRFAQDDSGVKDESGAQDGGGARDDTVLAEVPLVHPQSPLEILRFAQDDSGAMDDGVASEERVVSDGGVAMDDNEVSEERVVKDDRVARDDDIPAMAPVLKQRRTVTFRKLAVLLPILLVLLVGGSALAVRLSHTTYLSSRSATPTSILLHKTAPYASSNATAVLTPTPSSIPVAQQPPTALPTYPKVAKQYSGTLADIPTSLTTGMTLTGIQEQQGNINGYFDVTSVTALFNGLPANGRFEGTITPAGRIHLTITSDTGQAAFSFEGSMQPEGTMAGTYCSQDAVTGTCSDYGLWSVSPAASKDAKDDDEPDSE